ncbi:MAG: NAD-dependent epimerase/dehydratase family protein [Vicinamibacteraceae bacterium]|nr:NAD-dependent epimerase/dehydratase family protein [Vicinamibacteraceae bacterium]
MQTILGAGGVIGRELSPLLAAYTDRVRQVSRTPQAVHASDETVAADLLDAASTADAVAGSEVVYLVAGLRYDARVWAEQWPRVMTNVIDACRRHRCRLVFLDNVYAYGLVEGPMTEETPYNPCSRKGEVRARIATMLSEAVRRGELEAMIVRAADFYGPRALLSLTHATVTSRLTRGKAPQWVGDPSKVHTFSYTPDVARSLAVLGNTPSAYGQTWHALTSPEPITGEGFVRLACELAGRPFRLQRAPRWLLRVMGLVVPELRENMEMMYQFEHDYRFDSGKLARAFALRATEYREGLAATLAA